MDERQLELLHKALELYAFTIGQHDDCQDMENEFFRMREKLSEILDADVT